MALADHNADTAIRPLEARLSRKGVRGKPKVGQGLTYI